MEHLSDFRALFVIPDKFMEESVEEIEKMIANLGYDSLRISNLEYVNMKILINEIEPDLFVLCNDQPVISRALIHASKSKNIPILLIQDGVLGIQKENLASFFAKRFAYLPKIFFYLRMYRYYSKTISLRGAIRDFRNRILSRDIHQIGSSKNINFAVMGNYFKNIYENNKDYEPIIHVTGSPLFDYLKEGSHSINKQKIVNVNSLSLLVLLSNFVEVNLWSIKKWRSYIIQIINATERLNIHLKIRPHPTEKREKYKNLCMKYRFLVSKEEEELEYDISNTDLALTYFSTAIFDAIAANKIPIIYNFDNKPLYFPFDKYFNKLFAVNISELRVILTNIINDYENYSTYFLQNRKKFINDFLFKLDGKAAFRISELIKSILR